MSAGRVFGSEMRSFRDPDTGAEITQYTSEGKTNRTLYFTNRSYLFDGEHAIFLSDRTGRNEMFLLHLASGKITQVSDLAGQPNVSSCLHPRRPELYFHNRQTLHRVRLDTLKTEELLRAPEGFGFGILNLNSPPWLAFEMIEKVNGVQRPVNGEWKAMGLGAELHYLRPRSLIYRMNVDTGEVECLWSELRLLTHVQISPVNPDLLIFSDWAGYGRDRAYYMDLSKKVKSLPRPIFPENQHARGGHECFTRRGNLCIQWMEGDLERLGNHRLFHAFRFLEGVPTAEIDRASFKKYLLPELQKDLLHHYTMSHDETWGLHDRWLTAPSFEENMGHLSVFRHQDNEPQTVLVKVLFHNGAKGDRLGLGPEPCLDAKDENALYTSFLDGNAHLCEVKLAPFVERVRRDG